MDLREIEDREEITYEGRKLRYVQNEIRNTFKKRLDKLHMEYMNEYFTGINECIVEEIFKFLKDRV